MYSSKGTVAHAGPHARTAESEMKRANVKEQPCLDPVPSATDRVTKGVEEDRRRGVRS